MAALLTIARQALGVFTGMTAALDWASGSAGGGWERVRTRVSE
jgi:hypothetical protein